MEALSSFATLNITVELFAAAIMIIVLISCVADKSWRKTNIFAFFLMCITSATIILISDSVSYICESRPENYGVVNVATGICVALSYGIYAFFAMFMIAWLNDLTTVPKILARIAYFAPTMVSLCAIIAIASGNLFYFDSNMYLMPGELFVSFQIAGAIVALFLTAIIIQSSNAIGKVTTLSLISFTVTPTLLSLQEYWLNTPTYISYAIILLILYMNLCQRKIRKGVEQEKELAEKDLALAESRVDVMISQIQPHFLYNTLTTIARLCDINPPLAKETTLNFADYLRGNLRSLKQRTLILFEEELSHVENYVNIEKTRFGDLLNVEYDIEVNEFKLPPMSVQPLVENAIKHGVGQKKGGGTVTISTKKYNEGFYITVSDDGVGYDPKNINWEDGTHIGINNVKNRLKAQCDGTLSIDSEKGKGTSAVIFIPKEEAK